MSPTEAGLLIGIASVIVTVLALIADEVRDRRFRRAKSPRWTAWRTRGWSLFDPEGRKDNPPENKSIIRPTVTRVAFWNAGFDTIVSSDVSPTDPFRITGRGDTVILEARLVRSTGGRSQVQVSQSPAGGWVIAFDYLRPGAGGLFAVTHTGRSEYDVIVRGELVEGKELRRMPFPYYAWHDMMPPPARSLLGARWSHRLFVLFEVTSSYVAIYLLFFDEMTVGLLKEEEFHVWVLAVFQIALQTAISLIFLRGWRISVPESLRPFDRSDAP